MKTIFSLSTALLLAVSLTALGGELSDAASGHSASEEAAVRAAVLDYVEGIYEVDPSRIERSIHPELWKRGFGRRSSDDPYQELKMTFEQLVDLASKYNKDGRVPEGSPKEVVVYEILDQTASVKLIAQWGIDYMHLAKYEGRWKIANVMWQTHPPE